MQDSMSKVKPTVLPVKPENIPDELKRIPRWVCWSGSWETDAEGNLKLSKMPINPKNGRAAKTNDPANPGAEKTTWGTFEQALTHHQMNPKKTRGIGFVFDADGIIGIDLDKVRNPETGEILPWAHSYLKALDSYTEISPSGTGFKVFVRGTIPSSGKAGQVEMYDDSRFFTVTGHRWEGASPNIHERPDIVMGIYKDHLGKNDVKPPVRPSRNGHAPDRQKIVDRAAKYVATMDPANSGQGGHGQTFNVACVLALGFELEEDEAWPILCDYNDRCQPPWKEKELRHKLTDALKRPGERGYLLRGSNGQAKPSRNGSAHAPVHAAPRVAIQEPDPSLTDTRHDAPDPLAGVKTTRLSDVTTEPVEWFWQDFIPYGAITIIDSFPDMGKTMLTHDLAARATRGLKMPPHGGDSGEEPTAVILVSAEDDIRRTIRPRLEAAGADLDLISTFDAVTDTDGLCRFPEIPTDLDKLEALILRNKAKLVVIDPITACFAGTVDSHNDASIRRAMHPLKEVAERTQAAIVLIRHFNKCSGEKEAINRGTGSVAIGAASRSNLGIGPHPEDVSLRVLYRIKGNLSAPPAFYGYRIDQDQEGRPHLSWLPDPIEGVKSDQLLHHHGGRRGEAIGKAKEFLLTELAKGPRPTKEMEELAADQNISKSTLARAFKELGIVALRPVVWQGPWRWSLPQNDKTPASHNEMSDSQANRVQNAAAQESLTSDSDEGLLGMSDSLGDPEEGEEV